MTKLFSSDWHLNHKNILTYCNRQFDSIKDMEETFFNNFENIFKCGDVFYFLGDFAFANKRQVCTYLDRLYDIGVRDLIFVCGNHDKPNSRVIADHKVVGWFGDRKLISIPYRMVLDHYPMYSWYNSHRGSYMLHGHCHGNLLTKTNPIKHSVDVGIDSAYRLFGEYRPFTEGDVLKVMDLFTAYDSDYFSIWDRWKEQNLK